MPTKLAEESGVVFMLILIDGYNLIRQSDILRRYERQSLEEGRRALIAKLIEYEKRRGHKITVVFDGWKNGPADEGRDRAGKINIIYSRHGEKADDVIKRIAAHTAEDTLVVSSDREIVSYITRCGKTALTSVEFEVIMKKVISPSLVGNFAAEKKEDHDDRQSKKKGPARRLPRAKRQAQIKINKL
jgi:predicted RNA-binding protein with PIN domain